MSVTKASAHIAVTGLGVMGSNLARNLARHGYRVAIHNRSTAKMTDLYDQYGRKGDFVPPKFVIELIAALRRSRQIILWLKSARLPTPLCPASALCLKSRDVCSGI